jgi:kynurenine formamidase
MDSAAVTALLDDVSNWGRWGEDDRAGTLNLIGAPQRAAALSMATGGQLVSLARPVGPRRASDYGSEFVHFMTSSGLELPAEGAATVGDWMAMGLHGRVNTHLDAHSHIFWNGRTYNDLPAADVSASRGARKGGLEPWFDGAITRGVLIDIPRARGAAVAPGEAVTAAELSACLTAQGVRLEPGDALAVRTGYDQAYASGAATAGAPGLDISCVRWLRAKDVAVLLSDATHDVAPPQYESCEYPIHTACIVAMGMWLVDNADLARLSEVCEQRGQYAFCLVLVPTKLKHATGAPVNPIAVF